MAKKKAPLLTEAEQAAKQLLINAPNLSKSDVEELIICLSDADQDSLLTNLGLTKNYAFIQLQTFAQREALEQFVTTELFPHVNDQQRYFI